MTRSRRHASCLRRNRPLSPVREEQRTAPRRVVRIRFRRQDEPKAHTWAQLARAAFSCPATLIPCPSSTRLSSRPPTTTNTTRETILHRLVPARPAPPVRPETATVQMLGGISMGVQYRRRHEIAEQGMRCIGARLELWMELASHHPGMVTNLADLDQQTIRR